MTTLRQIPDRLPERCWDLSPATLRSHGAVDDFDIESHALAEFHRDTELGKAFATESDMSPRDEAALMAALRERQRSVWGRYSKSGGQPAFPSSWLDAACAMGMQKKRSEAFGASSALSAQIPGNAFGRSRVSGFAGVNTALHR